MAELTEQQKKFLDVIQNESHKIGHLVGFKKLTPLHHSWIYKMLKTKAIYVLKAHRGSYKSTAMTLFFALSMVLRPDKTIIFVRKTDDDVKEIVEKVKKILVTPIMVHLAYIFHGINLELTKSTAFEVNTNLKKDLGGGSQLMAMGLKGSLTGKHADIIVVDDIVNLKDRESKKERDITKNVWYELNSNIKNPNGCVIAIGTTWHPDDAFSVMPQAEVHTCYETGLLTDEQIQVIKENMPPALFSANYELRFVASEDCLFFTPEYVEDETLIENGLCHVDAGYGGGDYTAFTALCKKPDGSIIGYGKMWRRHVNDCIPEIESLIKKHKLGTLYMENNGDKGYLQKEFQYRKVRCMAYHERMNKNTKITTHLYRHWKNIKWLKKTDEQYMAQVLDYTENAEHDDAPDSCASLLVKMFGNTAKPIKGLKI